MTFNNDMQSSIFIIRTVVRSTADFPQLLPMIRLRVMPARCVPRRCRWVALCTFLRRFASLVWGTICGANSVPLVGIWFGTPASTSLTSPSKYWCRRGRDTRPLKTNHRKTKCRIYYRRLSSKANNPRYPHQVFLARPPLFCPSAQIVWQACYSD